jgi:putative protease
VRSLGALADGSPVDGPGDAAGEPERGERIADFSFNVTNRLSACEVLARGVAGFTPAFDLDAEQLIALLDPTLAPFAEVVVHHRMALFHMEHCVIAHMLSKGSDHKTCGRPCEKHAVSLRDRSGIVHPVEADVGCRNTVFHGAAQSAAGLVPALVARGVRRFRIELVREDGAEVSRLVRTYLELASGRKGTAEVWRELRSSSATNGYGVVRGSLRVIA